MFIGHFAVGYATKRLAPRANLAWHFIACQLLDLLWPMFVIAGMEWAKIDPEATKLTPMDLAHYPYSHSLIMSLFWSALLGIIMYSIYRDRRTALILGCGVFSHWLLDFISHRPDLPIFFDGPKFGLGLWNYPLASVLIECSLFALAVFYCPKTRPKVFWSLVGFIFVSFFAFTFGPQPPIDSSPVEIAAPCLALWLLVIWAYFVDRPMRQNSPQKG